MPTTALMTGSATGFAVLGLLSLFLPDQLTWRLGAPAGSGLLLQLMAAVYLAFAVLNWVGRRAVLGGIYGRAIVVANFMHGLVAATVLAGVGLREGLTSSGWLITAFFAVQAVGFARLMLSSPALREPKH